MSGLLINNESFFFDEYQDSAIADCEGLCRRWKEAGIAE